VGIVLLLLVVLVLALVGLEVGWEEEEGRRG
jgi:hypothetical protein